MMVPIHHFLEVTSTMDVANEFVKTQSKLPFAILADSQNKGRGRRGREWWSLSGNLLSTVAIKESDVATPDLIALIVGLSLLESLSHCGIDVDRLTLKWPNDILLDGAKLGGVLIEKSFTSDQQDVFLIGIGVNLKSAPKGQLRYPAANLKSSTGVILEPENILKVILRFLAGWIMKEANVICSTWMKHADPRHRAMTILSRNEVKKAALKGVSKSGAAIIEYLNTRETVEIYAGDISFSLENENQG